MADVNLFTPGRIDGFDTKNRIIMAPMTRSRALAGGVPSELAIEYYTQRASAGLILTEGVAPAAMAFFVAFAYVWMTPGISLVSSARGTGRSCMPCASVHIWPAALTADGEMGDSLV